MKLLGYKNIEIAEVLDKSRTYVSITMKNIRERMERKNYL
jgi:DNA-directed RNA polymerase specialized sigma24 family protein